MNPQNNLFKTDHLSPGSQEVIETVLSSGDLKIERIVTLEPYSEPGEWYDQEMDEWVLLIQGSATLEFQNKKKVKLIAGDYIFIPSHKAHRISQSDPFEKCIWLAIHGNLK